MEKGPKIGKSLEGDVAIPEFTPHKTMENTTQDEISEVNREMEVTSLDNVDPSKLSREDVLKLMLKYPDGVSEKVINLIKRYFEKHKYKQKSQTLIDKELVLWFQNNFSINFAHRKNLQNKKFETQAQLSDINGVDISKNETRENKVGSIEIKEPDNGLAVKRSEKHKNKIQKKLKEFLQIKKQKMEALHMALRNLDDGEPIDEFRDETRRVLYFDEDKNQYFTEEAGQKKYLGIGDVMSDYAWGIKYVPDGEMTEPAYRTIAKKILTNETRRAVENVYNEELARVHPEKRLTTPSKKTLLELWSESGKIEPLVGLMAEIMVRELMSRTCLNNNLSCVILRANSLEDSFYKYDFKIRAYNKNRGVDVKRSEPKVRKPTKIGFQLKTRLRSTGTFINVTDYKKGKKEGVDEVLILTVTTDEFGKSVKKWVETGKLSGGPEQFLSPKLKMAILKAVTEKLVDIPQEILDKLEQAN